MDGRDVKLVELFEAVGISPDMTLRDIVNALKHERDYYKEQYETIDATIGIIEERLVKSIKEKTQSNLKQVKQPAPPRPARRSKLPAPPKIAKSGIQAKHAAIKVLEGVAPNGLDISAIMKRMEGLGWRSNSKDKRGVVSTLLADMTLRGQIDRIGRGLYRAKGIKKTDDPVKDDPIEEDIRKFKRDTGLRNEILVEMTGKFFNQKVSSTQIQRAVAKTTGLQPTQILVREALQSMVAAGQIKEVEPDLYLYAFQA